MLSIIVPTYNSQKTISYCLESIINQTYQDFECLVVDYPCNLETKKIVIGFANRDNRIKYVESVTKGAVAQRSKGILLAKGEYIGFVDSDDIIPCFYFENHINAINTFNADFSQCGRKRFSCYNDAIKSNISPNSISFNYINNRNYYSLIANDIRSHIKSIALYSIVVRREAAIMSLQYYNTNVRCKFWEDAIFSYYIFYNSKSCVFIDNMFYLSINNPYSVTNNVDESYFDSTIMVSTILLAIIKNSGTQSTKECSIYILFGSFDYLLKQKTKTKKAFTYVRSIIKKTIGIRNIKTNFKEFSLSEKLLAIALKYNLYLLSYLIVMKNNLYKKS